MRIRFALAFMSTAAGVASAQVTADQPTDVDDLVTDTPNVPDSSEAPPFVIPGPSASVSTFADGVFDADLKGGGTTDRFTTGIGLNLDSGFLSLDGTRPASPADVTGPLVGLSLGINFAYHSWDLEQLGPQGAAIGLSDDLLEDAYSFGFNPRVSLALDKASSLAVGAFLSFNFEDGADIGDSFTPGGFIGYRRELDEAVTVLFGVAAFYEIDDDLVLLPLITIDIDYGEDAFYLASQGLGTRVGYRFEEGIALSTGINFNGTDFLLADGDRLLMQQNVRADIGVDWTPSDNVTISGRVGADLWGEYEVLDDDGRELFDVEADPAVAASATVSLRL